MPLWPSPHPAPHPHTHLVPFLVWKLGKDKNGSSTQIDAAFHVLYGSPPASPGFRARGPFALKLLRGGGLGLCYSPVSRGTLGPGKDPASCVPGCAFGAVPAWHPAARPFLSR